jgi:hypothetical protein
MPDNKTLAKKIFINIQDTLALPDPGEFPPNEGDVTSVNDFMKLLVEANDIYAKTFAIADSHKLVIAEEVPREIVSKLNNQTNSTDIDATTLKDLRVVTYCADEKPGIKGAHKLGAQGTRVIKYRLVDVHDDPQYTGYSVLRYGKEIDAVVSFKVWGLDYYDIRQRAKMLREIIDTNTWFFKHKGLREIAWEESVESEVWDNRSLMKMKSEKYLIKFMEIKETREKNLEQIVAQFGLS